MEQKKVVENSANHFNEITKVYQKARINNEFPIILMDAVYPNDLGSLSLIESSQIYLETCYIHLGQRDYQKAFVNYVKARSLHENTKNQITEFFFAILEAQIYEAAAKDGMALLNYHKAKCNCMLIQK